MGQLKKTLKNTLTANSSKVGRAHLWQLTLTDKSLFCFGSGFSALLAPLAPLAMSVHSCVEFRAKKKKKKPFPSGLQTSVCVIMLLSEARFLNQAEGGREKKEIARVQFLAGRLEENKPEMSRLGTMKRSTLGA